MKCEHFIYSQFGNDGYKLIPSKNLHQLLSKSNVNYLTRLSARTEPQMFHALWSDDNVFTISYLRKTQDNYKREGVWNHTIAIPLSELNRHFIQELKTAPKMLEPIELK